MPRNVAVSQLKAKLSEHLAMVKAGEELLLTEHGRPVARVTPFLGPYGAAELAILARLGVVRLPEQAPNPALKKPSPVRDRTGAVLRALIAGREEGR
jgi:prevent-host-death family protein